MNAQPELATRQTVDLQGLSLEPRVEQPLATIAPVAPAHTTGQVLTPSMLIQIAMTQGDKDLDRLERLLKMEADWKAARAKEAYDEDFARFTKLGLVVPKTKLVKQKAKSGGPGPTFWQSEYDHVCRIVKPALGEFGFGVTHKPSIKRSGKNIEWIDITCVLTHRLGHTDSITLGGPPDDSGSKNASQEIQSTITFWERHTLLAITSTAQEGKDNDGRGARGYREDGDPEAAQGDADVQRLVDEGNAAADKGESELNKWWGFLVQEQRNKVMPFFAGMKADARKARGS
jgi:hypothetical protein